MAKRIVLFLLIVGSCGPLLSQQLPIMNLFRENWTTFNPASPFRSYMDADYSMSAGILYRHQWARLPDAPRTMIGHFQFVSDEHKLSAGGNIFNDQTGAISTTGIQGNFAYRLKLRRGLDAPFLSIGLSASYNQYRADFTQIVAQDELINLDPQDLDKLRDEAQFYPDFGVGVFYHVKNHFYAGLSVPQIFTLSKNFMTDLGEFPLERVPHYYAIVGGTFDLGGVAFFEPSAWVRYVENTPVSVDVSLRYKLPNVMWIGVGGGLSGVFHGEFGVSLYAGPGENNVKIAFGYDHFFKSFSQHFGETYELSFVYSWGYNN